MTWRLDKESLIRDCGPSSPPGRSHDVVVDDTLWHDDRDVVHGPL